MVKIETLRTITILLILVSLLIVSLHFLMQNEINENALRIDSKIVDVLEDHAIAIRELQEENQKLEYYNINRTSSS